MDGFVDASEKHYGSWQHAVLAQALGCDGREELVTKVCCADEVVV